MCYDGQAFLISPETVEFIWELTMGHPGATRAVLDILLHDEGVRPFRQWQKTVPHAVCMKVVNDDRAFFGKLLKSACGFKRSLPRRKDLTPEDVTRVHSALSQPHTTGDLAQVVYIFPTHIHRRYFERLVLPMAFPFSYDGPKSVVIGAIKRFSRQSLLSAGRIGPGAMIRPAEAQYQDELYRTCYELLGGVHLTSEWAGSSTGRIDFQIKSQHWGIEIVRDGLNLQEHLDRFELGGVYGPLISSGEVVAYTVVYCRSPGSPRPRTLRGNTNLLYAIFSQGFSSCKILDNKLDLIEPPFPLFQ
ncbi:hypothetical protein FN846DRAFT_971411 [Sphaerosporella brunnea]|uniref:Uncharacterized protein n=1 Tax=Sphaerosporella brunnea TaxID=1250544 RepID=A0A5J5EIU2_9PEZI|nr:hypothetical protein FN846DRAFT_971411 [Sphaerosporella brunnea]